MVCIAQYLDGIDKEIGDSNIENNNSNVVNCCVFDFGVINMEVGVSVGK